MKDKGSQVGWRFWLQWVLASTVGVIVGLFMGSFPFDVLLPYYVLENRLIDVFLGIGLGIGVGLLQWLVLRRHVSGAGWWVLTSVAGGYGIMQSVFEGLYAPFFVALLSLTGVVALGGAVTGILQWLVLRGQVSRAGWWVLASTVGWWLGEAVAVAFPWGRDAFFEPFFVDGAVLGAVTGGALVWLLRQPLPEA